MTDIATPNRTELATFAGGCFWCMEPPFDGIDGVLKTLVGYTGGHTDNPDYRSVTSGKTGHAEAVQIQFNPDKVSYETLLDIFWRNIDPTTANGQFVDKGSHYRPVIFFHSESQRIKAVASKKALANSNRFSKEIVVEITPATAFWAAEGYHQDYYIKNPLQYKFYKVGSGRPQFLKKIWGKENN